jgi:hypothetical protein
MSKMSKKKNIKKKKKEKKREKKYRVKGGAKIDIDTNFAETKIECLHRRKSPSVARASPRV